MKNLKNPWKRLYSRVILHGGVIVLILVVAIIMLQTNKVRENRINAEHDKIMDICTYKIDSISKENELIREKQKLIELRIDSIDAEQSIIDAKKDEKIKYIYSATADSHAKWLVTTIDSLKANPKLSLKL